MPGNYIGRLLSSMHIFQYKYRFYICIQLYPVKNLLCSNNIFYRQKNIIRHPAPAAKIPSHFLQLQW